MARKGSKRLARAFYDRPTLEVAPELLGKYVVYDSPAGRLSARIVEVEAYIGRKDPACHAAPGLTLRNQIMFGKPGFSYIYFIYGMYHCLNFVTEREGFPAAVLLRAAEPGEGLELMQHNSPGQKKARILSGPGKFCRSFGLTVAHNGLDLTGGTLFLEDRAESAPVVMESPRIGVRKGVDQHWRFYDANSAAVSRRQSEGD